MRFFIIRKGCHKIKENHTDYLSCNRIARRFVWDNTEFAIRDIYKNCDNILYSRENLYILKA